MSERTDITRRKTTIKFISKPRFRMNAQCSIVDYWKEHWWWRYWKVSYSCFYDRVKHWRSREEAIQKQTRKYCNSVYKPKQHAQTKNELKPEYSWINITYSKEEARVFKEAFEKIINDLLKKYESIEEPQEANKIFEKIEKVKADYQIFLHHNS